MSAAPARARRTGSQDAGSSSAGGSTHEAATGSHRSLGRSAPVTMPVQRATIDGGPNDPFEREAATVARRVVSGQDAGPVTPLEGRGSTQRVVVGEEELQRIAVGDEEVQRIAVGDDDIQRATSSRADPPRGPSVAATLRSPGPGRPIPSSVRATIEPRMGASLGGIQVHEGPAAAGAAAEVGARAFTTGPHIFLGEGESPHDLGLMAHEAAHTVQQGATSTPYDRFAPTDPRLQRLPGSIRSGLGRFARHIPGYTLFSVIIGADPITGERVERNARNLVGGLLGLLPFGTVIFDKLVELGVIDDALAHVEAQLSRFGLTLGRIERMLTEAWDEMDFVRLDPFDHNLGILLRKFGRLLSDVTSFAGAMVDAVMELIRDAVVGVADGLLADEPAWSLIKKVLGHDPLRDEPVEATTVEMLEDFLVLIGREQELEQMRERGTLQEAADWLDEQLGAFMGLLGELGALFTAAWEAIQPSNLPNLATNLRDLASRAVGLLGRAWDFAWEVAAKALELVKQALLNWLSEFAHEAPGFHLLTVILERNPFTDEPVPRTAENLIKGFITLLPGGDAAYAELSESGVIGQAAATIEGAMSELGISWEMVTDLFLSIWEGLSIDDLIDPIGAFQRIRDQFGGPIERIFAFIRVVLTEVIGLILKLMNFPSDVLGSIIANASAAYEDIKNDPVQFLLNLLLTVKEGFSRFLSGIFGHLLSGLTDWLFRGLRAAGIEPPSELTLETGLDLVMQVLGLTMDRMWEKLAERIGQERVDQIRAGMDRLEGLWTFVRDVQERGPAAIWEHIQSQISGLWDSLLQQARDWVMTTIVQRVTTKLLSMLDPTGVMAVVNSFIAFFNAIQSAIEYIRDLLDIVDQWVGTLAAVARGDVEPGAARLELGLISAVPVAIGFLANQVGLGNIGDRLTEIIGGLRAMVDEALDWLLDQAERLLQQVMAALGFGPAEDAAGDEASADPTDHVEFARYAAGLITALQEQRPEPTVERVRDFALERQPQLSERLEDGIGLRFEFPQMSPGADANLAFRVVIAPNTTVHDDAIRVVDVEAVRAAISEAEAALGTARERLVASGDEATTFAAGGGEIRQVGGGSLREAERDPDAAMRWLEADSARWGELGAVHGAHLEEMTTLTDAAQRRLDRATDEAEREAILTRASSYRYAGATAAGRSEHLAETGEYLPQRHAFDRGVPGATSVVHAEKLLYMATASQAIGVSRAQCGDCRNWFTAQARSEGRFLVVADPGSVRVFMPDGQVRTPADFA